MSRAPNRASSGVFTPLPGFTYFSASFTGSAAGSCMRSFAARGMRPFSFAMEALVVRFGL